MGQNFSAKDFRTWAGTLIAACVLARLHVEAVDGRTDSRKLIVAAIKETAAQLGNTPAVRKASYIWPSVLRDFEKGRVLKPYYRTLDELVEARNYDAERALLELLKTGRSALPAPPQRAFQRRSSAAACAGAPARAGLPGRLFEDGCAAL